MRSPRRTLCRACPLFALIAAAVAACSNGQEIACGPSGAPVGTCQAGPSCPAGSVELPISDPADSCSGGRAGGAPGLVCCVSAPDVVSAGADASAPLDSTTTHPVDATTTADAGGAAEASSAQESGSATDAGVDTPPAFDSAAVDGSPPDAAIDAATDAVADGVADAVADGPTTDAAVDAPADSPRDVVVSCGSAAACAGPADCPATASACVVATCVAGCCGTTNAPTGTPCDDGNACTQTDTCQGGTCTGSNPIVCAASDECHAVGTCSPTTGACSNPAVADGTPCSDGNACYSAESCQAGVCAGTFCASSICGASLAAFSGTQTPNWNFNGSAFYDAASSTAVLTDGTANGQAGTILYKDAISTDAFTVAFDFRFGTSNGRADGLVFVIETDGPTQVGQGYGGFGVLGLHGFAAELDIFDSGGCDPGNGNHAGIDVLSPCGFNTGVPGTLAISGDLFAGGVGDIGDGAWRTANVTLANGGLSLSVTNATTGTAVSVFQPVTLTGFVPGSPYYFGFGGGTGSNGLAARSEVRNVTVTFPAKRCL